MPQLNGDQADNILFGSTQTDEIRGLDGSDHLIGVGGTDLLLGGNDDDTLIGGAAVLSQAAIDSLTPPDSIDSYVESLRDTLTGGAGADRFVFSGGDATTATVANPAFGTIQTVQYNLDMITDFTPGTDRLVLVSYSSSTPLGSTTYVIDEFAKLPAGSLPPNMLRKLGAGESLPVNGDDFLIYGSDGILYYDSDGTQGGLRAIVQLLGAPSVTASDIEIIETNVITGTNLDDALTGTSGLDRISSLAGNDLLEGGLGDDILSGGAGINKAVYWGERGDYLIVTSGPHYVADLKNADVDEGVDRLTGITRLLFQDVSVAYDLAGNAGNVARILGAVFGEAMVADRQLAGIGLHYIDGGLSYEALMQMAIEARLGIGATNRQVVDLLYGNVVGSLPSEAVAQSYVQLLENGTYSQAALGVFAANHAWNESNIDLIGLAESGLLYSEYLI